MTDDPSTGGSHAGTTAQGGTAVTDDPPTNGGGGVVAAGNGGRAPHGGAVGAGGNLPVAGAAAGAQGLPPVDGRCPPNSIKHPDQLCYCQPATLNACADGCGDFQVDPDHCGNCTTQCGATQACNSGVCGPQPKLITDFGVGCTSPSLALAGSRLYYTDSLNGTVASITTSGTAPLSLATGQSQPALVKVDNGTVFWLARGTHSVMRVSSAGGVPQTVATNGYGINGFTLGDNGFTLYFGSSTNVLKVPAYADNSGSATLVGKDNSGLPFALAASATMLAMTTEINGDINVMLLSDNDSALCAAEESGVTIHNCTRPARSQGGLLLDHIELVGDQVYWVNQLSIMTSSASKPTGFNDTIAQATSPLASMITAFTLTADQVFFADDAGTIYRAPLMTDSTPTVLARGQGKISSIVTDGKTLYWVVPGCSIISLPAN